MLSSNYYESISFSDGKNFNTSRSVDPSFLGKLHWHPFTEILVSLNELNRVSINFTKYRLGCNDILVIYPGDLHSIDVCSTDSLLVLQFSDSLLTIVNELKCWLPLLSQYPLVKYSPFPAESDQPVLLIKKLFEYSESDSHFREVGMYSLLLHFFELIGNHCMRARAENDGTEAITADRTVKKMAEACLYISQNCTRPLMLKDISGYLGISKSRFSHLFKEYTGITFVDYLAEERIRHAQNLFLNPKAQIIDIAFDSGFASISSFNRAFKKVTGLSPSKFRETMIGQPEKNK